MNNSIGDPDDGLTAFGRYVSKRWIPQEGLVANFSGLVMHSCINDGFCQLYRLKAIVFFTW